MIDKAGNAVAVTYTLNGGFGAGVMADGTGFLMNNEMDDFTIKPGTANHFGLVQGEANTIAPGKRPLSSMAPTIVLKDGRVSMVLGSPGGPRIITIVLETILNMVDHGMTPQEAVDAPRVHHQWLPDTLYAERDALSPDTRAALEAMGYTITVQRNWGAAALIAVGPPGETQGAVGSSGRLAHPLVSGHSGQRAHAVRYVLRCDRFPTAVGRGDRGIACLQEGPETVPISRRRPSGYHEWSSDSLLAEAKARLGDRSGIRAAAVAHAFAMMRARV